MEISCESPELQSKRTIPTLQQLFIVRSRLNPNISTDDDALGKSYVRLTEGPFKLIFNQHTSSFKHEKYSSHSDLSSISGS